MDCSSPILNRLSKYGKCKIKFPTFPSYSHLCGKAAAVWCRYCWKISQINNFVVYVINYIITLCTWSGMRNLTFLSQNHYDLYTLILPVIIPYSYMQVKHLIAKHTLTSKDFFWKTNYYSFVSVRDTWQIISTQIDLFVLVASLFHTES